MSGWHNAVDRLLDGHFASRRPGRSLPAALTPSSGFGRDLLHIRPPISRTALCQVMSGNPFGLSEISHYGSMQRVGGKAGGFINKKFFHPSSLRNQEKLWKAQTEHAREERQQAQLEKQREEERAVEALKKQMYLQGRGTSSTTDFASSSSLGVEVEPMGAKQKKEQRESHHEFRKRKAILKQEAPEHSGTVCESMPRTEGALASSSSAPMLEAASPTPLAKSLYTEDVFPKGHTSVWGSWYTAEGKRWGFACCRTLDRMSRCPLAPEVPPSLIPPAKGDRAEPRGKRRRKGRDRESANKEAARHAQEAASGVASTVGTDIGVGQAVAACVAEEP